MALPFFGIGMKTALSSPVATSEFSKFAGILSAALSQHHLSGFGASPSPSQLLAFAPAKEQAAGVWETYLAPGWPQLRSGLPFGPR